jgi:hypothetical protein
MTDPTELERQRRQALIDMYWQAQLLEKELKRKRDEEKSFHRGPDDPDWEYVK